MINVVANMSGTAAAAKFLRAALCGLACLAATGEARLRAAELELRSECRPESTLVLLGDVATVYSQDAAEAAQLAKIDLVPTPPPGEKRTVRLREIQDLLVLRGVNLVSHRFSGASQTIILGDDDVARPERKQPAVRDLGAKRSSDLVAAAIGKFLKGRVGTGAEITANLSADDVNVLSQANGPWQVEGGHEPFHGRQQFVLSVPTPSGAVRLPVEAEIALPPAVVVATACVARGATIRPSDVCLQPGRPAEGKAQVYQSLEEVVGKEATRQVAPGQILDDQMVRKPLLVKRGDIVTVYARTAGMVVRTNGRAKDDGSMGDVITVESITNRATYFARVHGPQEVDVQTLSPAKAAAPRVEPKNVGEHIPTAHALGRASLSDVAEARSR